MSIVALDIGGANLKCARDDGPAQTLPFALWRHPDKLPMKLRRLIGEEPAEHYLVTMTGELCDCFATRSEGVNAILDAVQAVAGDRPVHVWSTDGRFLNPDEARRRPLAVAAANWHALASFVARHFAPERALLIDVGSTTTDLIPIAGTRVAAIGYTDPDRLATGELVYLGVARTPLAALADSLTFKGRSTGLVAELFATTVDLFTLSGDLPEDPERTDTADGRPRTRGCAAARLLRMIGADLETHDTAAANELAHRFTEVLMDRLTHAAARVTTLEKPLEVVVSGSGEFLAHQLARQAFPDATTYRLSEAVGIEASGAACAHALVQLWNRDSHA